METNEIIELWKKLCVDRVEIFFSCGGDSMGDFETNVYYKNDNPERDDYTFISYFEDNVYDNVEFYDASDGVYLGEYGTVVITYEDGDYFLYDKNSTSEYNESYPFTIDFKLESDEINLLQKNIISNMNGGYFENSNVNYSTDCILTDEDEEIIEKLLERIDETCSMFRPDDVEGEEQEEYSWEIDNFEIESDSITISGSRNYYVERSN